MSCWTSILVILSGFNTQSFVSVWVFPDELYYWLSFVPDWVIFLIDWADTDSDNQCARNEIPFPKNSISCLIPHNYKIRQIDLFMNLIPCSDRIRNRLQSISNSRTKTGWTGDLRINFSILCWISKWRDCWRI